MATPSLFVIIPGFGGPHYKEKVAFLENNLKILRKCAWSRLTIRICVYDPDIFLYVPDCLRSDPSIEWIVEQGIVGQFIHKHAPPQIVETYDYVLIILDDIELEPSVDFERVTKIDKVFHMDVYSPCMTLDSKYQFQYMLHVPHPLCHMKVVSACEAFCYFMPTSSYHKYYMHIDPVNNPWIWGLDMGIHKCLGLRVIILNNMLMKHHYKNECYQMHPDINPCDGYNHVLSKFNVTSTDLADQKAVLYWIFESEL